jgi:hypothetical protein
MGPFVAGMAPISDLVLLGRLFHGHELTAILVTLSPGRRPSELRLELRALLNRSLPRIVSNRLIHRNRLCP